MRAEPTIEAIELVKTYKGGVTALAGLSFDVEPGTVFGLLGPNGAGKSTTVKILTTLSTPDNGTALVGGVDVAEHPERVRHLIGAVAQESGSIAALTGRQNLRLQGDLQGMPHKELSRRSEELLGTFALTEAADRTVKTYSGGMRRRLDIAIALVHQPEVLFLDEPTTGLDPEARADTWRALNELAARQRLTILLTTHYLEEADQFACRLAIIDRGRIVAGGTPEELKAALRGDSVVVEMGDSRGAGIGEQSIIIVLLGWALGARFPSGVPGVAMLVLGAVLIAVAFAALSNGLSLVTRTRETLIAAATALVLPLSFLSFAFMQANLVPGWIAGIARYNPVNWAVEAGRSALAVQVHWTTVGSYMLFLVASVAVSGVLATRAFPSYQRSI